MRKQPCVYILANRTDGPIYTGVTTDLIKRVYIHRNELLAGHTSRYHIHRLVWFEAFEDIRDAIVREKRIKNWRRAWRVELIEKNNPEWSDLYPSLVGQGDGFPLSRE